MPGQRIVFFVKNRPIVTAPRASACIGRSSIFDTFRRAWSRGAVRRIASSGEDGVIFGASVAEIVIRELKKLNSTRALIGAMRIHEKWPRIDALYPGTMVGRLARYIGPIRAARHLA